LARIIWLGLLGLAIAGCDGSVLLAPQIPTGGINSGSADENPSYSSDGRYLAFATDRQGERNIFLFDYEQRRLVDLPNLNRRDSSQDQPALSGDGRFLVYISNERGKPDVMLYDRQSQRSQLLTANVKGTVAHPTISGDGSKIAFQTRQSGQWKIATIDR
jgi:Tol biopolymer transport system component